VFSLQRRWTEAGLCAFLAGLTKAEGLSAAILIGYEYLASVGFNWRKVRVGAVAALSPFAALALFSAYLWMITGDPCAWFDVRVAWAQGLRFPWAPIAAYPMQPMFIDYGGWNLAAINWIVMLLSMSTAVYLIVHSICKKDREELGFGLFAILFVLAQMITAGSVNFGRYSLTIFPLFIAWGKLLQRSALFEAVLLCFAGLLALLGAWMGLGLHAVMV
jgi:hypothetical protein